MVTKRGAVCSDSFEIAPALPVRHGIVKHGLLGAVEVRVMLDHVFALNRAAAHSGQEKLIAQLGQFQNACRDAARRVGLVPLLAAPGEAFDAQRHQSVAGDAPAAAGVVAEQIALGFTFQGKLIRTAVVRVEPAGAELNPGQLPPITTGGDQSQLPLSSTPA